MAFQVDEFMNVPEDEVEAAETGGAGEGQAVVEQGNGAETTQTLPAETVQVAEQAVTTDVGQDVATQANDTGTKDAGTGASETEEAQPVADVAAVAPAIIPPRVADPPVAEASTVQKADASIQHEPLPGASVYAFSERIEQGSGDAPDEGVIDQGGALDAAMEAPPISMAVRQSMESDLAPPLPAEPQVTKEAAPPTSAPHQQDPYNRPDLQLSMAALQQAASILQSSNQTDASARNAVSDASQALQNVALLQSMVRLLPTEGLKMKHGRPSRFKGVTPHHSRWQARIKEARRDIHLGYFNTEEAAVRAYDRAVLKFRGAEGLTNLCAADYEEPATVHTPTDVPGKVDAATMTPIDCAESKGANPLPHGYSPEQDDLLPGLMRCPKCGKMKTGDGTQPITTAAAPPAAPAPRPLPPLATPSPAQTARTNMQMSLAAGPPSPLPSALPSPTALVSQAGLSSTLEAYQSVLGSFGSQTVAEFWSAAAAALSPPNGIGALSPRDAAPAAQKSTTAGPSSSAPPMAPALPSQTAPPLFTRPRPEAIQNVLVHPVTSLATLAAMDALVLREAGIDPELFFNTQKRRALQRTSAYRGITRHHGRWQARIKDQRRDIHLGYFDTEIAAARAYDQAALRYRGTKAQLNFPETDYPPELKQEGERRVAAGALQDVEDPIIAQKRKELLGTLRAERAQAKRQKVLAQGGKPKARRVGGAPGQPDAGELPAGWQGQQGGGLVGAEGTMPLEAVNTEGVQASGVNGSAPVPVQPGLLQLPAPGGELGQVGAEVAQSVAEVEMPGPIPVAESVSVAEDGMAGPIPVAAEVPGVEPWVPGGEGPADQEIHATIPLQT